MAYATPEDVALRLGRELDDDEGNLVAERLDDVEEMIRLRIPDLDDKVVEGSLRERLLVFIECEAVLRLIRNPEGFTAETDGSYSYEISAQAASGRLEIRPEEWAMLGVKRGAALFVPKIRLGM